jgi:hypothetical protein
MVTGKGKKALRWRTWSNRNKWVWIVFYALILGVVLGFALNFGDAFMALMK